MKTYKRGISLIVLVITIIVLSILATVTIVSLSNVNIVDEARDTVDDANAKQLEEALQLAISSYTISVNDDLANAPKTVTEAIEKLNSYMPDDFQIETSDSGNLGTISTIIHGTVGEYNII